MYGTLPQEDTDLNVSKGTASDSYFASYTNVHPLLAAILNECFAQDICSGLDLNVQE
jgi:hypothetical protein